MTKYGILQLKRRIKDLEQLCDMAGVPLLIVHCPQIALKKYKRPPTKESIKWVKDKIEEYEKNFPKINT